MSVFLAALALIAAQDEKFSGPQKGEKPREVGPGRDRELMALIASTTAWA